MFTRQMPYLLDRTNNMYRTYREVSRKRVKSGASGGLVVRVVENDPGQPWLRNVQSDKHAGKAFEMFQCHTSEQRITNRNRNPRNLQEAKTYDWSRRMAGGSMRRPSVPSRPNYVTKLHTPRIGYMDRTSMRHRGGHNITTKAVST